MNITFVIDWWSVMLLTIALLIMLLFGVWLGMRATEDWWRQRWNRHNHIFHGIGRED